MPNTLRIKRRASGNAGAPASLANAELAFNEVDNTLYYGKGSGGAGGTATTVEAIGGSGAYATLTSAQTISGAKTFSTLPVISASLATSDNSTNVATTAFVKGQGYLTSGSGIASAASQDATIGGTIGAVTVTLKNVGAVGTYTKVTTDAQGRVSSGGTLSASDIPTLTASKISDFDTQVRTSRLDQMAQPAAVVQMNSQRITSLATPVFSTDAATKGYVDTAVQGLDAKASVRLATTANIATLGGLLTIDGVTLADGDRVLVKNQTNTALNGIYTSQSGTWTRSFDADSWDELRSAFVFVEQGTVNGDTGWTCTVDTGGTLDTTAVTWVQFSGAGSYLAGTGLSLSGNTFNVVNGVYTTGNQSIAGQKTFTDALYATGGYYEFLMDGLTDLFKFRNASNQTVGVFGRANNVFYFKAGSGATSGLSFGTNSTVDALRIFDNGSGTFVGAVTATQFNGSGTGLTASTVPIASLVSGDFSGKITSGTYSISITGNAGTVTNGVYTNVAYVDPMFINSLSKSKVGLGNVENTALSTWAGSGNITTVGTLSAGVVPTSLLSGDLDGGTF